MLRCATSENKSDIPTAETENGPASVDEGSCPETTLGQRECLELLAMQFSFLSDRERLVLRMKFIDELDVREIGRRLETPRSTVQDTIQGAVSKLRNRLEARL